MTGARTRVVVHDHMQRGYTYYLTEPAGKNFAPEFTPELTPKQMLRLGVFGGKYMTDCRDEFPPDWFTKAKLAQRAPAGRIELLRGQRLAVPRDLANERLDPPAGSTRVVPVVLSVLHGPPDRRRSAADPAMARDRAPCGRRSGRTANRAIWNAANDNVRPCCTGRTTAARSERDRLRSRLAGLRRSRRAAAISASRCRRATCASCSARAAPASPSSSSWRSACCGRTKARFSSTACASIRCRSSTC